MRMSRAKAIEPRSPHLSSGCRKWVFIVTLLVFLTFPLSTHELGLPFGEGAGDESKRQVAKRRPFEKKFKFHKIERINDAHDDDDNGDVDADCAGDDERASSDDDDDTDVDNNGITDRTAADSSQANEAEEMQFERARSAHKQRRGAPKTNEERNIKRTAAKQQTTDSSKNSILEGLFGSFFGAEKAKMKKSKTKQRSIEAEPESEAKSNDIIEWLIWLTEKVRGKPASVPPPPPPPTPTETWLSYFNRWPFTVFFPIGQSAKPIRMPRRGVAPSTSFADNSEEAPAILSQEHFESLLHTLPGFVANASQATNTECRHQLQIFQRQLRGNKLWTLQMLDATGKITAGLLRGNINQLGDFELCTQVKTLVKVTPEIALRIRGKYCLAHIETQTTVPALKVPLHMAQGRGLWNSHLGNPGHFVPRYSVANWGICIPNACTAETVREMLEANLGPYNTTGVEFHIEVDDNDCEIKKSKRFGKLLMKDGKFRITVLSFALLALMVLSSLFYAQWFPMWSFLSVQFKLLKQKIDEYRGTKESNEEPARGSPENAEGDNVETEEGPGTDDTGVKEEVAPEAETTGEAKEDVVMETDPMPLKRLLQEIFKSFSPQRTLNVLIGPDQLSDEFPIFHVLRLGATFALYVCLKFLLLGHLPITNRDRLVRAVDHPSSMLFRTPMIYMDVLLLISGFFASYQLSVEMEHKSYIQLLKRLAAKTSRYLPTLYVVLCFQTWILPHLGAGPLWTNLIDENSRLCEQQIWRNFFSVQNAIDFEETCSPMSIQLALEVQLFLLGPLIVWLYYTDADAAFFVYGGIHALSVAARFSRTQREHLSMVLFHGMNVSKFYRTANLLFASPISRATPYLLGIGAGMLHRAHAGNLDVTADLVPVGWGLALLGIVWCFWSPASSMRTDFIYSASDAASYAAWCPLIMGLALVWIIFMFPKGENSMLRFFTTLRPILFLSRIAFPLQLVSYVVVLYGIASVKEPRKFEYTDLINFNELGLIVAFAIVLAFLIDVPSQHIRQLLVQRVFIENPHVEEEEEPSSGTEPSEMETESNEGQSDKITSEMPEPQENIWGSEQEQVTQAKDEEVEDHKEEVNKEKEEEEDEKEQEEENTDHDTPPAPKEAPSYTRRRHRLSDD